MGFEEQRLTSRDGPGDYGDVGRQHKTSTATPAPWHREQPELQPCSVPHRRGIAMWRAQQLPEAQYYRSDRQRTSTTTTASSITWSMTRSSWMAEC
eukprot:6333935-Heterocapsa_arctica.AAC.1